MLDYFYVVLMDEEPLLQEKNTVAAYFTSISHFAK